METSPSDQAMQRHRAYSLLSSIFAKGITPDILSMCQDIPFLEAVLPGDFDEDQTGAEYQDLFGFNVLPYAGVFLSEDGQLGGAIHQNLNSLYESFGFEPVNLPGAPDHISTQLEFLSFLSGFENDARDSSSQRLVIAAIRHQQGEFLHRQLISWCFPLLAAIKSQSDPFYSEVAELTQALIVSHFEDVKIKRAEGVSLPLSPDILNDSKTGIKEIASFLCRPIYCGVYVTRKDIMLLAGSLGIPSGFGDRAQILSNTFRSAINFDTLPALLERLRAHVLFYKAEYEAQKASSEERLGPILKQWILKTEVTLRLLAKIESELINSSQLD